ncbi:MAG TPA: hypothetical protein VEW74_02640, partial [Candidatus Nitrosotalea sp.]|nr:hypothetical protein [Candidatus Nitrosotalea sp.]
MIKSLLGASVRLSILLALAACAAPLASVPANSIDSPSAANALVTIMLPKFTNSAKITNQYLPMIPGVTDVYNGKKGPKAELDTVYTMRRTKRIIGIPCVIQLDTGYLNGQVVEKTLDYFAQDAFGNVWYFGEDATQYRHGKVNGHRGSWMSGKNGAQPGILMEAVPRVGDQYNQENAPGLAEDKAEVLSL